jgi:hypothetical protein
VNWFEGRGGPACSGRRGERGSCHLKFWLS